MKAVGFALLISGVGVLIIWLARPIIKGIADLPLALRIGLSLVALGIILIIIMALVDKFRGGGE